MVGPGGVSRGDRQSGHEPGPVVLELTGVCARGDSVPRR